MIKLFTVAFILFTILITIESFAPGFSRQVDQRNSVRCSTSMFYFDDISRRSSPNCPPQWTPSTLEQIRFASSPSTTNIPDYAAEKLEQLQKSLHGYDATIAGQLTANEIQAIVQTWLSSVDFDSEFFSLSRGDQCSSRNIKVCNGETIIECLSEVWDCIDDSREMFQTKDSLSSHIEFMVFPHCPRMYSYDTTQRILLELRKCAEYCNSFGKEFIVSAFHPNFNNEPRMLSPIRHAPFPCFGLHTCRRDGSENIGPFNEMLNMRSIGNDKTDGKTAVDPYIDSMFHEMETMDQDRSNLEAIFNSEAFTGSYSDAMVKSIASNDEASYCVEKTQHWMIQQYKNGHNPTLKNYHSIGDRWIVTSSRNEETIYREIWNTIQDVIKVKPKREALDVSVILIASKFSLYDAQRFKRMAVSINKSLRNAEDEVSMELFHPEFVGLNDAASGFRRSPFPTLQFIIRGHQST